MESVGPDSPLSDMLRSFSKEKKVEMCNETKEYSNGQMIITDENEASLDYSQVPEKVQEICRNWFLKCVCIREVLPRIYLELSLVRSARFKNIRVQ